MRKLRQCLTDQHFLGRAVECPVPTHGAAANWEDVYFIERVFSKGRSCWNGEDAKTDSLFIKSILRVKSELFFGYINNLARSPLAQSSFKRLAGIWDMWIKFELRCFWGIFFADGVSKEWMVFWKLVGFKSPEVRVILRRVRRKWQQLWTWLQILSGAWFRNAGWGRFWRS